MRSIALAVSLFVLVALAAAPPASAANFVVNQPGSQGDDDAGAMGGDDNDCDINAASAADQCTLRAAIQEANDQPATAANPHTITFSGVTAITLTLGLDTLTAPTDINGAVTNAATGGRLELNGNDLGCFQLAETDTSPINATGARGSTIRNFVIRNCGSFGGIGLSGHGYTISGNRIGTNGAGTASSTTLDSNSGYGISVSGTITPPSLPDISGIIANPPANFGAIVAFVTSLSGALTAIANPTTITGNLISGNQTDGIVLNNPMTVNVLINTNIIGLDQSTTIALPNGHGGGSFAGIRLGNGVYGNVVGPANIISGHTTAGDDGIVVATGEVLLPNFIMGNLVGLGNKPIFQLGNSQSGIRVDTRPDTTGPSVNPTGFSLFIGPANTISDNQGVNNGDPDGTADNDGGIVVGESDGVRIFGNQIGAFAFPAGGTPVGNLDVGNAGNGIIVTDTTAPPGVVQIGGSEAFEANFILRNGKHGINVRGSQATRVRIQNNFIGVMPDGLDVFDFANAVDGIHTDSTGSLQIGGTGQFEDNVIAGNGRHGIALRNGNLTLGWANHIQRNQIYRNTGLGIDLDVTEDLPDPTDDSPDQDPNDTFYANWGQNRPVLTGINGAVQYTFESAPNRMYRLDLYQDTSAGTTAANVEARTWISETTITTDANGDFNGSLAAPSGGGFVTVMATDISPAADVPGPGLVGPHNNSSEISNGLELIEYSVNDPSVVETNAGTTTLTFVVSRTGSNTATGSVDVVTADNTATTGDGDYVGLATQTVNFGVGQATANVQVTVNGDTKFELDETLFLNLSNPVNGVVADAQGVGTITNDDAQPTISISDVTLAEGTGGSTTAFTFNVTLSNPSSQTITVSAASANGTATLADNDYAQLNATTVTFTPNDVAETVTVLVNHDGNVEPDETFFVNLTAPSNATTSDAQGLGTITNDDGLTAPDVTIGDLTQAEGSGGGTTTFSFTVTLSSMSASMVTVNYMTADGSATTADSDYTAETSSIQIPAGMLTGQITIDVAADNRFENNENFVVNLTGATNGNITDNQATGTINNDDAMPTLSVSDPSVTEGNAGTVQLTYVVSLSAASGLPASVNAASADGTATTADNDYTALASTPVNFAAGQTTQNVSVTVNGDTKFEPDETVLLNLSGESGATIADGQGSGTIQNDDGVPTISIADASQVEGNAGSAPLQLNVTLSNASSQTVTVNFQTADGSATTADNDYQNGNGTVTFNPGVVSQPATVTINGDTNDEGDQTFVVNLSGQANATIADGQATVTILNDDAAVGQFSVTDVTLAEGNAGTTSFVFQVTRSSTVGIASVSVQTMDGGASTGDSDYTAVPLTVVNFAAGDASEDVTVLVNGDLKHELDETFTLQLSVPVNGTILDGSGTGTITNDDAFPTASAAAVSLAEGNAGTTPFTFNVTLSNPSALPLQVDVSTTDGSATVMDNDYQPVGGTTLFFAPGDTSESITVNVVGDTTVEPDETFTLSMNGPQTATRPAPPQGKGLPTTTATGTIVNDDGVAATYSINDVALAEGNSGTTAFTFTVTRTGDTSGTASVTAQSAAGVTNPATGGGVDYNDLAATPVNFTAGSATAMVTVLVVGEVAIEVDETFVVNLSNPSTGTIADGQGLGTIQNDDFAGPPTYAINDVTLAEGNAGTTAFTFTITRGGDLSLASSVTATSASGGATPATGGGVDYNDLAATVVSFPIDATTATVTVNVVGEVAVETDETFVVNLSNAGNGQISDGQGLGTIVNDDASAGPTYAIGDVTQAEGNAGNTAFTFTITRGGDTTAASTVTATSAAGGATPATGGGNDYADLAATVVSFAAGATSATVTVQVVGDTTFEPNETFLVNLTNASSGAITDAQAIGTITNDDATPSISIADVGITEGNAGNTPVTLTLSLSNASSQSVTVTLLAVAGSASTGDFVALGPITVTFVPGSLQQTVTFNVVGDTLPEGTETVTILLSVPGNGTILDGTATVTIADDDAGVGQGPATPVPALSPAMLAWLAALLGLVAMVALRRRRMA